jgi:hypothetical protein
MLQCNKRVNRPNDWHADPFISSEVAGVEAGVTATEAALKP